MEKKFTEKIYDGVRIFCIFSFLLFIIMLFLAGCEGKTNVEQNESEETSMFVFVENAWNWRVVYHRDTKVMYVVSCGSYNGGNFTVLVNPDGTPMLYDENSD